MRRSLLLSASLCLALVAGIAPSPAAYAGEADQAWYRLPPVEAASYGNVPAVTVFDPLAPPGQQQPLIQPITLQDPMPPMPPAPAPVMGTMGMDMGVMDAASMAAGEPRKFGEKPPEPEYRRVEQIFLRQQNVLLQAGEWQFDYGFYYFTSDFDFPASNNGLIVRADIVRRQIVAPLAFRYGVTDRLQFFAALPVGWRHNELITSPITDPNPVEINEENFTIGDTTIGSSYHLLYSDDDKPDVIFSTSVGFPTGELSLATSTLAGGLGSGFYTVGWQFLFVHTYDPVTVYYGFGHRHFFGRAVGGVDVQPGEEIDYQFGVGFAVNDRVTLSTAYLGSYVTNLELNDQTLEGSEYEPSRLRFALTALRNCRIVEPFVEIGTSNKTPQSRIGITWTY